MSELARLVGVSVIPRITREVRTQNPVSLLKKLSVLERLCETSKGIGLCAVQVGWDDSMFVVKEYGSYRYFVNASYTHVGDSRFTSCEGCLSLPGRMFLVPRFRDVRVTGQEILLGQEVTVETVDFVPANNLYTAVYQHEIDHVRGVMIDEIGQEIKLRPLS